MLLVLVTGAMGAGKSSVSSYLETKGYPVFQADVHGKKLLKPESPCYAYLKQVFDKDDVFHSNKEFDRKKLARFIFKYPEKRKLLEAVIHPFVRKFFESFIQERKEQGRSAVFYEASLISNTIFDRFDKTILVVCPAPLKLKRLVKKGWTEEEIKERWAVQVPDSMILNRADFIINNKGDLKSLNGQIDKILPFFC